MLKQHPIAKDITPPLTEMEYNLYEEDILKNGQIDEIVMFEGMILDKWHMYKILMKHNKTPRFKEFKLNGVASAEDFVIAKLQGRNLTSLQLACIAAQRIDVLKKDTAQFLRDFNKIHKGRPPPVDPKSDKTNKLLLDLGKKFKISMCSISRMRSIYLNCRDIFDRVKRGEIALNESYRLYKERVGDKYNLRKNKFIPKIDIQPIVIPSPFDPHEVIHNFLKNMNDHGWIFEMKICERMYYANFYGHGILSKVNCWNSNIPEPEFRRAVVTAAFERLNKSSKIKDV